MTAQEYNIHRLNEIFNMSADMFTLVHAHKKDGEIPYEYDELIKDGSPMEIKVKCEKCNKKYLLQEEYCKLIFEHMIDKHPMVVFPKHKNMDKLDIIDEIDFRCDECKNSN